MNKQNKKVFRSAMPCAIDFLTNDTLIILNRDYEVISKPYEHNELSDEDMNEISFKPATIQNATVWLFDDTCPPWESDQYLSEYYARYRALQRILKFDQLEKPPIDI